MSGDIGDIGDAVTAGLVGHAVEPTHGAGNHAAIRARCLNCGTSLVGSHCQHCGQHALIHRSFGAIGHDLVHAVFHFEGKLWNTLPLLAWRPGDLTRRFIHGERASFISPLSLFLFAVFLTYAVLAFVGSGGGNTPGLQAAAADVSQTVAARAKIEQELAKIDEKLAVADLSPANAASLADQRAILAQTAAILGVGKDKAGGEAKGQPQKENRNILNLETGIDFVDHGLQKAKDNPGLMLYKLQANAYKFAWALIPLSLPFLWLLFPFSRRFHTYDHFVFITYSVSFMLLLFVAVRLLELTIFGDPSAAFATLYVPFHMYRQLRGAYRLSRRGALLRTSILLVFCVFAVLLFGLLLLTLGAMG